MMRTIDTVRAACRDLWRDRGGTMAIETAIVIPALLALSLGAFDVSKMVARQVELQNAVSEAAQIALASTPDTSAKRTAIRDIIKTSTGITSDANVLVTNEYRCGSTATLQSSNVCGTGVALTTYLKIAVVDTFTPVWTAYGVGSAFNYGVTRRIIVA